MRTTEFENPVPCQLCYTSHSNRTTIEIPRFISHRTIVRSRYPAHSLALSLFIFFCAYPSLIFSILHLLYSARKGFWCFVRCAILLATLFGRSPLTLSGTG